MKFLRDVAQNSGRDPRVAHLAVQILQEAHVPPRQYKEQAEALLNWVQRNIYYVNEPNERLQDPLYTVKVGYGDCDDMVLLLAALFHSIRLDFRFVLSGRNKGKLSRWIEGEREPVGQWTHIYLMVGWPVFKPTTWAFCEPTIPSAKLGWDIIQAKSGSAPMLPELGDLGNAAITYNQVTGEYQVADAKEGVISQIAKRLHPSKLLVEVIAGAVLIALTNQAVEFVRNKIRS
tara:strand:- start:465 stop:1160 length:696 start_codon:yes stop_codon:yes gene_type:complete